MQFETVHDSPIIPRICAGLTFAIGATALYGWIAQIPELRSILPNQVIIIPNTAVGLCVMSVALWLLASTPVSRWRRQVGNTLAGFCILLGSLTMLEYLFPVDFGIDNILNLSTPNDGSTIQGRMAFYTAINFAIKGMALVWIDWEWRQGRRPSQVLSLLTAIMPLQAILGYVYGVKKFTDFGPYAFFVQMAPMTAVAWLLLSAGTLGARPHVGMMAVFTSPSAAGRFVRKLLLPAVLIPAFMGWFIATGERWSITHPGLGASVLALVCVMVFVFIVWKNGIELYRLSRQRDGVVAELQKATIAAEGANTAKTSFLANMSHEIRSPIGVMMGFADLIADPDSSEEERAHYARVMRRNGQALLTIIDDILDISKIEAGKFKIESVPVNLLDLVHDVVLPQSTLAQEKGLSLSVKWEGEIPRQLSTDPVRLRQILTNLLGNAVKFTASGSVTLFVRTLTVDPELRLVSLRFRIQDTGPGVAEEHVPKLFQAFEQADASTTRKHGGSGLGLALSKRLAQALGGDIRLEKSVVGKGSTFTLEMAAVVPEDVPWASAFVVPGDVAPENVALIASGDSRRLPGLKVLVVDDISDNRFLLQQILSLEGAEIQMATNGQEAVDMASTGSFDVVLMDIQMPVMDGLKATMRLREQGYEKPILALTAHAMKEDQVRSLSAGMNEHINKPVERESLIQLLERYRPAYGKDVSPG